MTQSTERRKILTVVMQFLSRGSAQYWLVAIGLAIFCELFSVLVGQDLNYDQLNYHLLLASDLLHGERLADFALAQRQSWLNPLPSVPPHLVINSFPPRLAEAILALMAVPAPLMAYVVFRRLIRSDSKTSGCETLANQISDFAFSLAALLVGVTGYVSLIVIGSTFSEVRIPALVLGGLCNLMQIATDDAAEGLGRGIGKYLAAGLMLGAAVGFKVTNVPFAVGCGAGILVLLVRGKGSWRGLGAYVIGGVAASFATGGWWLLKVFREYGDPVYPLLARALGSP